MPGTRDLWRRESAKPASGLCSDAEKVLLIGASQEALLRFYLRAEFHIPSFHLVILSNYSRGLAAHGCFDSGN